MNCPKCNRTASGNRKTCLYCDEPPAPQPMSKRTFTGSSGNVIYVKAEKVDTTNLSDLPDHIMNEVKDAFRDGPKEVTLHEKSHAVAYPSDKTIDNRGGLTIKKALSMLAGIKDSYRRKQIKPVEYEKLVLGVIQEYLADLDDNRKIQFVVNRIADSEFTSYLNDWIFQKLRSAVIESAIKKP